MKIPLLVMARGKNSDYAEYFDMDWNHSGPDLKGKLLFPFLEKS
jgi:(1->4)-alpha-D-glucan 1-alpha-D-glucosylmutase